MEQGSYLLIERGMTVQGTEGDLGTVYEVVADVAADIFRGIVLSHGLLLPKHVFVPSENIVGVSGRTVQVNLSKSEADLLPPPSAPSFSGDSGRL